MMIFGSRQEQGLVVTVAAIGSDEFPPGATPAITSASAAPKNRFHVLPGAPYGHRKGLAIPAPQRPAAARYGPFRVSGLGSERPVPAKSNGNFPLFTGFCAVPVSVGFQPVVAVEGKTPMFVATDSSGLIVAVSQKARGYIET